MTPQRTYLPLVKRISCELGDPRGAADLRSSGPSALPAWVAAALLLEAAQPRHCWRIRLIACADSSDFTKKPAAGLSAIISA